jgi:NADH-quinone oxidoreductase subunit M
VLLTWTVFLPLLGAAVIAVAAAAAHSVSDRAMRDTALKAAALVVSLVTFAFSLQFYFQPGPDEHYVWLPDIGAGLHLRLDGISLWLFLLTTFLTPICILASWRNITIHDGEENRAHALTERGVPGFLICLLVLETAMLGTFAAFDLLVFFVFWEMMLVPMYFLIGIWGSPGERDTFLFGRVKERVYATVKFILFTMAGSALMLVGVIYLRLRSGTFDLADITEQAGALGFLTRNAQFWLFWAFFLAFAIKVPLFPFHTWLPDAHVQAPTAGSVILAGILLKMGTYGIIRFCLPLFPDASAFYAPVVSGLAVVGILYGALVAMVQPDLKKLVAYSSVSHLGFVVLGLFAGSNIGVQGAVLQMVNHGLSTGALFLLVGMLYDRRHTRAIADFGGLARTMPAYAALFLIITFSSIGVPGTNGFVGEFLVLLGTFVTHGRTWFGVIAATGVILAAVYMLWMVQRVFFGSIRHVENERLLDLSAREVVVLLPIVALVFVIGLFPKPFLEAMDAAGEVTRVQKAGVARGVGVDARPGGLTAAPAADAAAPEQAQTESRLRAHP